MNLLVIDVGTSSMRGTLFSDRGETLVTVQKKYSVIYMENGYVEQKPTDWSDALFAILHRVQEEASANGQEISAVALTSQRSSVIPVDEKGTPLANAIMWQDKRTNEICAKLQDKNEWLFARCGSRANPVFSGSKMAWIRQNKPELYRQAYKLLVIPDYLIHCMTGKFCTDHTYGSRSLLMNLKTREWDDELLAVFQIDREKLCELVPAGSVCGYTTKELQEKTGIPAGIPVVTAGGDQQCGAIGQGVVREGSLSITVGTGGFLIADVGQMPKDLKSDVICNASSIPGHYILEMSILSCSSALDWFCRTHYDNWNGDFDRVTADLKNSPAGANGCIVLPYFQGRSTPDWNNDAKAFFANMTLNTSRADMLRALLEGICFEIANHIGTMEKYVTISRVQVNGGLTNNVLFNGMQADIYGRKLTRMGNSESTSLGAFFVAAAALGLYESVEQAFETVCGQQMEETYLPDESKKEIYRKLRDEMKEIYTKIYA